MIERVQLRERVLGPDRPFTSSPCAVLNRWEREFGIRVFGRLILRLSCQTIDVEHSLLLVDDKDSSGLNDSNNKKSEM